MQEIMDATDKLFHESSFHGISLTTIAKKLGWSRGNLYKYVETKEEIFLELYQQKHHAWIQAVAAEFQGRGKLPLPEFSARWSRVLVDHVDFLKYQNILALIIETNVSIEVLAEFKKNLWTVRQPLIDALKVQLPALTAKELRRILLIQIYHGSGLYQHVYFTPNLKQALALAGISIPDDDFKTNFESFLLTYLRGITSPLQ
jgi:AcrR family transcriptional regulator